jgi:hypothetical protein
MFDHENNVLLEKILEVLKENNKELREIKDDQRYLIHNLLDVPISIQIQFEGQEIGMPVTINNDATASVIGTPVELNAAGSPVAIVPANIQWSMQTPGIAAMVQNPDGTATFTPVAVGSVTVGVVDTVANLSSTDVVTVQAAGGGGGTGPTSLSIQWGNPVA